MTPTYPPPIHHVTRHSHDYVYPQTPPLLPARASSVLQPDDIIITLTNQPPRPTPEPFIGRNIEVEEGHTPPQNLPDVRIQIFNLDPEVGPCRWCCQIVAKEYFQPEKICRHWRYLKANEPNTLIHILRMIWGAAYILRRTIMKVIVILIFVGIVTVPFFLGGSERKPGLAF